MKIGFKPLSISDFPLLLKWLGARHVKQWWDQDISHTEESIAEKYSSYINSSKIRAFIINLDDKPIGYIQIYNAYDFPRSKPVDDLPKSLGAIDFYIGEEEYLRKGIGTKILKAFVTQEFDYIFVDPDLNNIAAIKTYENAGFKKIKEHLDTNEVWMIKENLYSIFLQKSLIKLIMRKYL